MMQAAEDDQMQEEEEEQEEGGPMLINKLEQFGISAQDCKKLSEAGFHTIGIPYLDLNYRIHRIYAAQALGNH
jgi:hypothetical protein